MATVVLARSAGNALAELDFLLGDAVLDALGELERDPHAGHALRGRLKGLRSYRVGAYRIIYELRDSATVRAVAIRHARWPASSAEPGPYFHHSAGRLRRDHIRGSPGRSPQGLTTTGTTPGAAASLRACV